MKMFDSIKRIDQNQIDTLLRLEEEREKAKQKFVAHQQIFKRWFDKHSSGDNNFEVGDLVLKWDKLNEPKGKHFSFQQLWLGPFVFKLPMMSVRFVCSFFPRCDCSTRLNATHVQFKPSLAPLLTVEWLTLSSHTVWCPWKGTYS